MSKYVIVDLEMCRVPYSQQTDEFPFGTEIIQIGAVALDENYEIADIFCSLVRPQYGCVDEYIHGLTGITRESTEKSEPFKAVMTRFAEWLPEDVVFVAWSDNDERQIQAEIDAKGLEEEIFDLFFDEWQDCQLLFSEKLQRNRIYKLAEALNMANIYYDDGAHDALVDAKNTALLFKKIMTEEKLTLSPYFIL